MFPVSGKSKYPEQFRRDAVELARSSDRPLRQVARELGINHETLRNWVRTAEQIHAGPVDTAAAVFAKEMGR